MLTYGDDVAVFCSGMRSASQCIECIVELVSLPRFSAPPHVHVRSVVFSPLNSEAPYSLPFLLPCSHVRSLPRGSANRRAGANRGNIRVGLMEPQWKVARCVVYSVGDIFLETIQI